MNYKVNVSAEAKRLIENQVYFIAVENGEPQNAAAWAIDVDSAIASLNFMPARCFLEIVLTSPRRSEKEAIIAYYQSSQP